LASSSTLVDSKAAYFYAGFNAGDRKLEVKVRQMLGSKFSITAEAAQFRQTPDGQLLHFVSNFARWENNFKPYDHSRYALELNAENLNMRFFANWQSTDGFIYLDSLAKPVQDSGSISVQSLGITQTVRLWKFYLQSNLIYQKSNNSEALRLPEFQFRESFYFEGKIRNAARVIRIGADLTGCSSFRSQAYSPYAGLFYNASGTAQSKLLLLDLYVSVQVRRARFFLKSEHINSLWSESDYRVAPHFPLSRHGIKLGLSWVFFD
jgi:hypothetical protein